MDDMLESTQLKPTEGTTGAVTRQEFKDRAFVENILRKCIMGDTGAMETVYIAYKTPLYNLAYRFTHASSGAEDLLQEIFIKVLQNIHRLKKHGAFDAWIYRIAVNTCISFTRKRKMIDEEYLDERPYSTGSNGGNHLDILDLKGAVRKLPAKQKAVFILYDMQGFSHREIAEIMKWTEGTSKSQLFKARMKL
ncbi:MAG: RNA polymerase sigma factor, partial [Desulfobacterales bacterium]